MIPGPDQVREAAGNLRAMLASMDGATRLYDLAIDGVSAPLWVESFIGHEALSTITEYRINALSTDATLDLTALRWRRASLRIRLADGSEQRRSGHLQAVHARRSDGGLARYELHLVSWNWLLTQQSHSRIWQDQPLHEIIGDVFAAYADAQWAFADGSETLIDAIPVRPYCVQYRESDHDFLSRLLSEEGLGWTSVEAAEDDGPARLVIFADSTAFPPTRSDGIRFHRAASVEQADALQTLAPLQRLCSSAASLIAFDPASKRSQAASIATAARPYGKHSPGTLERYRHSGHGLIASAAEAERRSRLMQEAADARRSVYQASGSVRELRAGSQFRVIESLLDESAVSAGSPERSQLAVLSLYCAGLNNLPLDRRQAGHALLASAESAWPEAASDPDTALTTAGRDTLLLAAGDHGYASTLRLQPANIRWRPPCAGQRQAQTAPGSQSAIVVDASGGSSSAEEIHRDRQGRIRVRFHWQQDAGNDTAHSSAASTWLRVVSRAAGPGRGNSFVPRLGQEVLVGFLDQDIDQPIVLGALYNGRGEGGNAATPAGKPQAASDGSLYRQAEDRSASAQGNINGGNSPAWHGHSADAAGHQNPAAHSGYKTQEFASGGSGYNQLALDDSDAALRVQLKTTQAVTELNLGRLIHQADNHRGSIRGSGFELRSDAFGAIRAARGVLIESRRQQGPASQPEAIGDFTAGISLLQQTQSLATSYDAMARTHLATGLSSRRGTIEADSSRLDRQSAPLAAVTQAAQASVAGEDASPAEPGDTAATVPHLGAAVVAYSAAAQLGIIAGQALQLAAGETLSDFTGGDHDQAIGGSLSIHSGQSIGVLAGIQQNAENPGITAIAAQGPLRIEAQNGTMNLDAKADLKLVSISQSLDAAAKTSITLTTKQGAMIKIDGGNIQIHCPGSITVHAAQHGWSGPTQLSREMNEWPVTRFDEKFQVVGPDEKPLPNYRYKLHRADGAIISGVTDRDGWTTLQNAAGVENLVIELLGSAAST